MEYEILSWFQLEEGETHIHACSCRCSCTCPGSTVYSDDVTSTRNWQTKQTDDIGGIW